MLKPLKNIKDLKGHIKNNIKSPDLNVEKLAKELSISRSNLYRFIKKKTGKTANQFIKEIRLKKSKELLKSTELTVSEISYSIGFSSAAYFAKCFKQHYKISPNEIKNPSFSEKKFFEKVFGSIDENLCNSNFGVEDLAKSLLISRSKLYRKIRMYKSETATAFIRRIRLELAKDMLDKTNLNICEISYKVGYSSPSYFSKCFKSHFGKIPKEIRN
nr:putative transcriptional regulator, AraC family (putative) [uncultured bacterium]